MRILHIISHMDPAGGGPQELVRLLLRHAPPGCAGEVVTWDAPDAAFLQGTDLDIHALGRDGGLWPTQMIGWLRAHLERFDAVLVHGLWEPLAFAVLRAVAGRKPYFVFVHGMLDPYFKRAYPLKHLSKWAFWLIAQYWVLRRAQGVLFTTAAERDLAAESFWLYRWKPLVVALGCEPPPADAAEAKAAFNAVCPAVAGKRFLLFLGRIDPKKGCDQLLEAFAAREAAATNDPGLHLVMAGPDLAGWGASLRAQLATSGVATRVHWPGMLQGAAKWGALTACEAFVLPSHQENFGIAVVEALACGKPVLITRPVNIAAELEADGCALVEQDTAAGVRRLLARWQAVTAEQRATMGAAALSSYRSRYDIRRNAAVIFHAVGAAPGVATMPMAEARS